MKIPTLEEVKEYFKSAKKVKGVCGTIASFDMSDQRGIHKFKGDYFIYAKNRNALLYDKDSNEYSEIISYKDEPKTDSVVESVINQFKERSEVGIKKYGTTLERKDLSTLEWIEHAKQEAMDFILYLERLKQEYEQK